MNYCGGSADGGLIIEKGDAEYYRVIGVIFCESDQTFWSFCKVLTSAAAGAESSCAGGGPMS